LPQLLNDLGCEVIELNSHVEESKLGSTPEQIAKTRDQLSRIVVTLGAAAGFLLGPSGEKMNIIDETGEVLSDIEALSVLTALVCHAEGKGSLAVGVAAPLVVEDLARENGLTVRRTKSDGRSLVEAAKERQVQLAASMDGRFAFPAFQPNFDALFSVAKILELLTRTGLSLSALKQSTRRRGYRHQAIPCSFEYKGGIMRKMSEDSVDQDASFIDGVKVQFSDGWVLVLPDQHRPVTHIVTESTDPQRVEELSTSYRGKVEAWIQELKQA